MILVKDYIKEYGVSNFIKTIKGKNTHFKTDKCEFFPKFDISGIILKTDISTNGEILCKTKIQNKIITVGSNMTGLLFEILP